MCPAFSQLHWKAAMKEEMGALEKNHIWEMANLHQGKEPIGYKWVFTVKYKDNGTIENYKARLVTK